MKQISRRQFIKRSILVGGSITAFPMVMSCGNQVTHASKNNEPLSLGLKVEHPHVNHLRVVSITDKNAMPAYVNNIWARIHGTDELSERVRISMQEADSKVS